MEIHDREGRHDDGAGLKWALGLALAVLIIVMGVSLAYVSRGRAQMNDLAAANQALSSSITQLKTQMLSMSQQLSERPAASQQLNERPAGVSATVASRSAGRPRTQPRSVASAMDPRVTQIQSRLADQEKALNSTRDDLNHTREDLQGKLDSTRDDLSGSLESTRSELSGSIARTHEDLVALQKRGERNYYEFDLTKSKEFRRVGPLSLSLRKANTKRKNYDLAMFVNDNQLQKKSVNLYEPVWITLEDRPQPVELIVNEIQKDQIRGYISEPKYKKSELGDTASVTPPK